ncbi:MAG: hypothetical protein JSR91_22825 [Proteobacteria bacterium]|nr:hypothetical protein [Pseudomonadota bacterium]
MRDLAVDEAYNSDQRDLDPPAGGRRDARQHPVDLARMREGQPHIVDDLVGADGAIGVSVASGGLPPMK